MLTADAMTVNLVFTLREPALTAYNDWFEANLGDEIDGPHSENKEEDVALGMEADFVHFLVEKCDMDWIVAKVAVSCHVAEPA